jgi:hypothetical protein
VPGAENELTLADFFIQIDGYDELDDHEGFTEEGVTDEWAIDDELIGDGLTGVGLSGDGVTDDGVTDDGFTEDELTDEGLTGDGVTDDDVTDGGVTDGGVAFPVIVCWGAAQFIVERSKVPLSVPEVPSDHVLETSRAMTPVAPAGSVCVSVEVWEGCPGEAGMV